MRLVETDDGETGIHLGLLEALDLRNRIQRVLDDAANDRAPRTDGLSKHVRQLDDLLDHIVEGNQR